MNGKYNKPVEEAGLSAGLPAPGLGVSQAEHLPRLLSFCNIQVSHVHPLFWDSAKSGFRAAFLVSTAAGLAVSHA